MTPVCPMTGMANSALRPKPTDLFIKLFKIGFRPNDGNFLADGPELMLAGDRDPGLRTKLYAVNADHLYLGRIVVRLASLLEPLLQAGEWSGMFALLQFFLALAAGENQFAAPGCLVAAQCG